MKGERGGAVIVAAIILFGIVIVGAVLALTIFTVKRSPAYGAAEKFIRSNPEIRAIVGNNIEFGLVPKSFIDADAAEGRAQFKLRVKGSSGSTQVEVLASSKAGEWTVVSARYRDRDGNSRTIYAGTSAERSRAFAFYKDGDYSSAIREYGKAIQANPRDAEAYYWRGMAYKNLQKADEAAADFRAVIKADPLQMPAYENLDAILSDHQAWDTIIALWTGLIELQPKNAKAYYFRAGGYLHKGDRAAAIRDADQSCSLGFQDGCRTATRIKASVP